jgi:tetratricopeptide (TPR) repeat protein
MMKSKIERLHSKTESRPCLFVCLIMSCTLLAKFAIAVTPSQEKSSSSSLETAILVSTQDIDQPNSTGQSVESLPSRLKVSTPNIALQNATAISNSEIQLSHSNFVPRTDNPIAQKLWQNRISMPGDKEENKYKIELQHLIGQIRSIRFEPIRPFVSSSVTFEKMPSAESEKESLPVDMIQEPVQEEIDIKPIEEESYKPIAKDTLQMLEQMLQSPGQLYDPLALGEVLFLSGYLNEAAKFYRQAFERMNSDDAASAQDRAWALFQTGNCLCYDDLQTAEQIYKQLLVEYPDTPWGNLAKARIKLIDWYRQVEPQSLIAELGS